MIHKQETTQRTQGDGWRLSLDRALSETRQALFGGQLLGGIRVGDTASLERLATVSSGTEVVRSIKVPADPAARLRFVRKWLAQHQRKVAAGSMVSMLVLPLLAQSAQAADTRVVLEDLDGVREIIQEAEGHLKVRLQDGRELELSADDVIEVGGQWHVDVVALAQAETEALLALEALDDVQRVVVNDDGSVNLVMSDGSRILLEAGSVQVVQGKAMATQAQLMEQGMLQPGELPSLLGDVAPTSASTGDTTGGGISPAIMWGGIAGAAGVAVAAGGSSSSSSSGSSSSSDSPVGPSVEDSADGGDSNDLESPLEGETLEGFVIDGYIADARVFRDEDGDGAWSPGEAYVFTDKHGFFTGLGGDPSAPIVAIGGIDISTGQQFTGVLKAPAGATVVTPLTTLVQAQLDANPELTVEQAWQSVATGLGLSDVQANSLLTEDPLAAAANGDAHALAIVKAGIQVATLLQIAADGDSVAFDQLASQLTMAMANGEVAIDNASQLQQFLTGQGVDAEWAASAAEASEQIAQADSLSLAQDLQKLSLQEVNGILPEEPADGHELPTVPMLDVIQAWLGAGQVLTISGSVESGDRVLLALIDEQGNTLTRSADVIDGRFEASWSEELIEGLVDGTLQVKAKALFSGANPYVSESSAKLAVVLDTVPPAEASIALVEDTGSVAGITRNGELEIAPAEVGATRQVSVNGVSVADYEAPSEDGSYRIEVTDTDPAGNSTTSVFEFVLDTAAPEAPTLALANDTGSEAGLSSDATLTLQAEPGSRVAIYQGDTLLGEAEESVEEPGLFTFTPSLVDGDYAFTAVATDGAGNASEMSAELAVVLDTAAPEAPTLALANDTGSEAGVTSDTTLSVQAEPGSRVAIYQGNTLLGQAVESSEAPGQFSLTPELADGDYAFTAVAIDGAGNVSETSAELTVVLDTTAPEAPTLALANDTGSEAGVTSDTTLTLQAEPGSRVAIYHGDTLLGEAEESVEEPGVFTFIPSLVDGDYAFTAVATDGAGNASEMSAELAVVLDTAAPEAPTLALVNDTGSEAGVTSDTTLTLQAESGSRVAIYQGNTLLGEAVESSEEPGQFSLTPELADGDYAFTAVATDGAGNVSEASTELAMVLDTVPPAEASIALVEDTGSVAGITRNGELEIAPAEVGATRQVSVNGVSVADYEAPSEDGSYRIEVTDTDPAGNSTTSVFEFVLDTAAPEAPTLALANDTGSEAGLSSDATLTLQAEPGSRVAIYQGDTLLGEAEESVEEPGLFTFTPSLVDGDYAFTAVATDGAGNASEMSAELAVVLDTAAPEAPTLALANDTGSEAGVTSDTTLTLQAESGSRVAIYQGNTLLGEAVESNEEPGLFTFIPSLVDGDYAFTAVAIDGAGNASEMSAELTVMLDTAAPEAPGLELVEDTGVSDSDGITNNGAVSVTGLEEGAAWEFSLDGGTTWLFGQGEGFLLEEGEYDEGQVQVRQVDGAGNASGTGTLPAVTVDITPPDSLDLTLALAEDTGVSNSDGITANGQVDIQGLDSDAFWEYSLDGGANWKLGVGEHFIVTDGVYPEDAIQVRQIDMAGNVGGETLLAQAVTVLTQAPEAPQLQLAEDTGVSGSDGITSNGAVTVSGLVEGEAWEYSIDGGSTWLTGDTQDGQGTFVLSEGLYQEGTVLVRQADLAGNLSDSRSLGEVEILQTPPEVTLESNFIIDGEITVDSLLDAVEAGGARLFGLAGAPGAAEGQTVEVTFGDTSYTAVVQADGSWNLELPPEAFGKLWSVRPEAQVTDLAGNAGDVSLSWVSVELTQELSDAVSAEEMLTALARLEQIGLLELDGLSELDEAGTNRWASDMLANRDYGSLHTVEEAAGVAKQLLSAYGLIEGFVAQVEQLTSVDDLQQGLRPLAEELRELTWSEGWLEVLQGQEIWELTDKLDSLGWMVESLESQSHQSFLETLHGLIEEGGDGIGTIGALVEAIEQTFISMPQPFDIYVGGQTITLHDLPFGDWHVNRSAGDDQFAVVQLRDGYDWDSPDELRLLDLANGVVLDGMTLEEGQWLLPGAMAPAFTLLSVDQNAGTLTLTSQALGGDTLDLASASSQTFPIPEGLDAWGLQHNVAAYLPSQADQPGLVVIRGYDDDTWNDVVELYQATAAGELVRLDTELPHGYVEGLFQADGKVWLQIGYDTFVAVDANGGVEDLGREAFVQRGVETLAGQGQLGLALEAVQGATDADDLMASLREVADLLNSLWGYPGNISWEIEEAAWALSDSLNSVLYGVEGLSPDRQQDFYDALMAEWVAGDGQTPSVFEVLDWAQEAVSTIPFELTLYLGDGQPLVIDDLPFGDWDYDANITRFDTAAVVLTNWSDWEGSRELRLVDLFSGEVMAGTTLGTDQFLVETSGLTPIYVLGTFDEGSRQLTLETYDLGVGAASSEYPLSSVTVTLPDGIEPSWGLGKFLPATEETPALLTAHRYDPDAGDNLVEIYEVQADGTLSLLPVELPDGYMWESFLWEGTLWMAVNHWDEWEGDSDYFLRLDAKGTLEHVPSHEFWEVREMAQGISTVIRTEAYTVDLLEWFGADSGLPGDALPDYISVSGIWTQLEPLGDGGTLVRLEFEETDGHDLGYSHWLLIDAEGQLVHSKAFNSGAGIFQRSVDSPDDGHVYFQLIHAEYADGSFQHDPAKAVTVYRLALEDVPAVLAAAAGAQTLAGLNGVEAVASFTAEQLTGKALESHQLAFVDDHIQLVEGDSVSLVAISNQQAYGDEAHYFVSVKAGAFSSAVMLPSFANGWMYEPQVDADGIYFRDWSVGESYRFSIESESYESIDWVLYEAVSSEAEGMADPELALVADGELSFADYTWEVVVDLGGEQAYGYDIGLVDLAGQGVHTVFGTSGNDTLIGNAEDNTLSGGLGRDVLDITAGGSNTLIFSVDDWYTDTVLGFNTGAIDHGGDIIRLSAGDWYAPARGQGFEQLGEGGSLGEDTGFVVFTTGLADLGHNSLIELARELGGSEGDVFYLLAGTEGEEGESALARIEFQDEWHVEADVVARFEGLDAGRLSDFLDENVADYHSLV
ncbi:Ig-like domain-containing protein [Halomonas mongoliensis]|uniref:Ig-like domain-containing protein n=1 Tax=Halomonas mongoliensis TaxID=321265 RepID=UPI00403AFD25